MTDPSTPDPEYDDMPDTKRRTRPKLYDGNVHIRTNAGVVEQVKRLKGQETQGEFLRQVLTAALADMDAGVWQPWRQPHCRDDGEK